MGTISVSLPADGETIDAADYNTPVNTIVTAINGNLDNANINATAAISGSKIADASITNAKLSTTAGELGGAWTTWSPTVVGFSSTTTALYYYTTVGKTVLFTIQVSGTSNSTSFTITLPTASASHITNLEGTITLALNNGAVVTPSPRWEVVPATSTTVMNLYSTLSAGAWTGSGTKSAQFSGFYEKA